MMKDDILFLSSGLAFTFLLYTIPLILLIFALAGFTLTNSEQLWQNTVLYLQSLIPVSSERITSNARAIIDDRQWLGAIGLAALALFSSRLFASLRTALDTVFEAPHERHPLRAKLFDLTVMLSLVLLVVTVNLAFSLLPALLSHRFGDRLGLGFLRSFIEARRVLEAGTFLVTAGLIFITYKFFPAKRPRTATCLVATAIAAVLIELTKIGYRYYLSAYPSFNKVYGTLGAFVILVFWFYISSFVYILAAEAAFVALRHPLRGAAEQPPE